MIYFLLILMLLLSFVKIFPLHLALNLIFLVAVFPYKNFNYRLLGLVLFGSIPVFLGFLGFFENPILFDLFRDAYYFSNPLLYSLIGFSIASRISINTFIEIYVKLGVIYSGIFLILTFLLFFRNGEISYVLIRNEVSPGNILPLISLAILAYDKYYGLELSLSKKVKIIAMLLNALVFVSMGSRTYLIIGILIFFSLSIKKISIVKVAYTISALLVAAVIFIAVLDSSKGDGVSFTDKLAVSFTEMAVQDYSSTSDMSNHLRGFEAFMAYKNFEQFPLLQQLLGKGFGYLLDLGVVVPYGDMAELQFVPIIHNGYFYILLKVGILGILFYLIWYFLIYRQLSVFIKRLKLKEHSGNDKFLFACKFGKVAVIALLFTNLVILGLFNAEMGFLHIFLFGTLTSVKHLTSKRTI